MNRLQKNANRTRRLAVMGMLTAIMFVLAFTPLGFIPIGPISATIMHIPVLICLLTEGFGAGMGMGLLFGAISLVRAYAMPTSPVDVIFLDPRVSILPRLLIPLVAWGVFCLLQPLIKRKASIRWIAWGASAFMGTFANTAGVLSMAYWLHGVQYAQLAGIAPETVGKVLLGVAFVNGIPEAVLSTILVPAIMAALLRLLRR